MSADPRILIIVSSIDAQFARLATDVERPLRSPQQLVELQASFDELVRLLDLAPPAARRACPRCGHQAMIAATRCGGCWTALAPG